MIAPKLTSKMGVYHLVLARDLPERKRCVAVKLDPSPSQSALVGHFYTLGLLDLGEVMAVKSDV